MDNKIKVSVIVPVYNAQEYILETAEYIKTQTLKDIQIIYIDDGSSDATVKLLKKIKNNDTRVMVLQQENKFAGTARNAGLSKATGKYVVFWDADDIFLPHALEAMYEKCESDNADICICSANHYDDETKKLLSASVYLKPKMTPKTTPFGHREIDKYLFNFSANVPWNKMFRRRFIEEHQIRFQEIQQANDNYFSMLAFFYAKVYTVVREPLINYRINFSQSLTGKASQTPLCVYEAYNATYNKLKSEPNFKNVKQSFINKTLRSFFYFLGKQTLPSSYEKLYNHYKENIFDKWDFPDKENYYYNKKDYERFCKVRQFDSNTFLMSEYRKTFDELRIANDTNKKQKKKIDSLEKKLSQINNAGIGNLLRKILRKIKRIFKGKEEK